ncbi:hypothetical protein [Streptomyces sp. NBC_00986]|uniref:hypothetical protein n=1 Tax=Streptomyces sp. NBC_00986 TaxID=2903702 RepID=UPI0038650969|nr:hypothetical protein OG504_00410 [Streptomyces sp. NBC_00986]WSX64484.1 hypothetical protein OG504_52340 [Streptomyces sp. NBC_00986]
MHNNETYPVHRPDQSDPPAVVAFPVTAAPPLRLAGVDEDDTAEPNIVRGID